MKDQIEEVFDEIEKKVLQTFGNRGYDDLRLMSENQFQREVEPGLEEVKTLFAKFAVLQYLYLEQHQQFYKLPEQYRITDSELEAMRVASIRPNAGSDIQNDPDLMPITKWLDRQGVFGNTTPKNQHRAALTLPYHYLLKVKFGI